MKKLGKQAAALAEELRREQEISLLRYRALRAKLSDTLIFVARKGRQVAYLFDLDAGMGAAVLLVTHPEGDADGEQHPWVGWLEDWRERWSRWHPPAGSESNYADEIAEQALCFRSVEVFAQLLKQRSTPTEVPPNCDLCGNPMLWQDEDADGPAAQWACFCNGGNYREA